MWTFWVLGSALPGCVSITAADRAPGEEDDVPGDGGEELPGEERPGTAGYGHGRADPVSDALFDHTRVHEVRIEMGAESESALSMSPREYVYGNVTLDGEPFADAGVRLKGNNSFRPLSEKPSFKLRLDEFVEDASYGRVNRVTLNNMIEDPSFAREILAYWLWNDAGVMAPRAAYAKVYVNDTYYGLYLLLEAMDDSFLERRFADPDGDLWEGAGGADFTTAGVPFFEEKSGSGDRARLDAIATAIATPTDDYYTDAGRWFEMDQVIDFWAWTMATANLDGYPYNLNDYFVYADPLADGRLNMSPWGMDESWNPEFLFQWGQGVALFGCAADNACLDRVIDRTEAALVHFDNADVPGQLEAFYALSEAAIGADTRATWLPADIAQARTDLLGFTETWPTQLRTQMYQAR